MWLNNLKDKADFENFKFVIPNVSDLEWNRILQKNSFDKFVKNFNTVNFNLVMAFDVIEHVEDVDKFIQQVGKLMKEDNFFIFSTIFIDSWFARMLGNNWPWIIPMHLSYFNQKNIHYFFQKVVRKKIRTFFRPTFFRKFFIWKSQ